MKGCGRRTEATFPAITHLGALTGAQIIFMGRRGRGRMRRMRVINNYFSDNLNSLLPVNLAPAGWNRVGMGSNVTYTGTACDISRKCGCREFRHT